MSFYSNLALTAKKLLIKFGQTVTVTRYIEGSVDPVTGLGTAGTSVTFTGSGAVLNIDKSLVNGSSILSTDNKLLFESTTEIMTNDKVTANGVDYKALSVKPLNPAGIVVIYDVQIRS